MAGILYLIPSPLGAVDWQICLPARSRTVACTLSHFIVENAKVARSHLKSLGHPQPLRELDIATIPERPASVDIDRLLKPLAAGEHIGLMSDAGCPGIADPGALLVARAHDLGHAVVPLVGPSSIVLALMASGLDGQRFAFHGYLPAREPERSARIRELERDSRRLGQTQIFIETPYRNMALLRTLVEVCGPQTRLCLASDLTATSEQVGSRSIAQWRRQELPCIDKRPTVFLLSAS